MKWSVCAIVMSQMLASEELQKYRLCFLTLYIVTYFVFGFFNGSSLAAVEEYRRRFPDQRTPSRRVFTRIHQTLRDTGCLPSVKVRSEKGGDRNN